MLNSISSCFPDTVYWALSVFGSQLDLSGSRDVIGDVTIRFPIEHFLFVVLWIGTKPLSLTVYKIFNAKCDAVPVVDMTLNDLYSQVKAIYFVTNRFLSHIGLPVGCQ